MRSLRGNRIAVSTLAFMLAMVSAGTCLAGVAQTRERDPHACCGGMVESCKDFVAAAENCCLVQPTAPAPSIQVVTAPEVVIVLMVPPEPRSFAASTIATAFDPGVPKPSAAPTYLLDSVFLL